MFGLKDSKFIEIAGWYGMIALITAYALTSFSVIPSEGLAFQLLNLTGGIGLLLVAAAKKVTQSVILNAFWAIIGVISIIRIFI